MCRLLGIVASEPTEFRIVLREVPRSLAALSAEHPDGWGLAIYDDDAARDAKRAPAWSVARGTACARVDDEFHKNAHGSCGVVLVSHVRQKTVGPTALENTHPFASDGWVFAHNGTIKDLDFVRAQTSPARAAEVRGTTDSELFFAWVLSALDAAGLTHAESESANDEPLDRLVQGIVAAGRARPGFGAFNFLLSNGRVTYAHRFGRSLNVLRRGPHDEVRRERTSDDGVTVVTPWSQRRHAVFIASERMTDEPWEELPDGSLIRIDRLPRPTIRAL
ncbi:MAG: class II glutamine amidotransferase [Polyangiaceae bacterium]